MHFLRNNDILIILYNTREGGGGGGLEGGPNVSENTLIATKEYFIMSNTEKKDDK